MELHGHEKEQCVAAQISNFGIPAMVREDLDDHGIDIVTTMPEGFFPVQVKSFVFESEKKEGYSGHGAEFHFDIGLRTKKLIACVVVGEIYQFDMKVVLSALRTKGFWICPKVVEEMTANGYGKTLTLFQEKYERNWRSNEPKIRICPPPRK